MIKLNFIFEQNYSIINPTLWVCSKGLIDIFSSGFLFFILPRNVWKGYSRNYIKTLNQVHVEKKNG